MSGNRLHTVRTRTRLGAARSRQLVAVGLVLGGLSVVAQSSAQTAGAQTAGAQTAGAQAANAVTPIGYSNLGGGGLNGTVAVVGNTAVVGAGVLSSGGTHTGFYNPMPCPNVSVKIVDLTDPTHPTVAATIPIPAGVVAPDVDVIHVSTPAFTGDLAAIAEAICSFPGNFVDRGVAYYDVTNRSAPVFLGRYFADFDLYDPSLPPSCNPDTGDNCASSQHEVRLVQRPDGKVLSLSTEPGSTASPSFKSGDMRIVDVTNPRNPTQVGSFPPIGSLPVFSNNGCRPFSAGHGPAPFDSGNKALLASVDAGVFTLNLANPAAPAKLGQFTYPPARAVEGNAAYVEEAGATRPLALVSEDDWIAPNTTLNVRGAALNRQMFACEAMFTLFDPEDTAQIYRHPGSQITAEIVYVGRGCPSDPLLADPAGKIAVFDRNRQLGLQPGIARLGCSIDVRVRRLQNAGAVASVVLQTAAGSPQAFSPDGNPVLQDLNIPNAMIDFGDSVDLRNALCPGVTNNTCNGHPSEFATLLDSPGDWGSLRVLDISNPATPVQVGQYRSPRSQQFPPPDLGVYAPQEAAAVGDRAYVPWHSDGLRVLDLTPGPVERGFFVPPDTPDPTGSIPSKAYVVGAAVFGCRAVMTDINSGLYVLDVPPLPAGSGGACSGVPPTSSTSTSSSTSSTSSSSTSSTSSTSTTSTTTVQTTDCATLRTARQSLNGAIDAQEQALQGSPAAVAGLEQFRASSNADFDRRLAGCP